MLIPLECSKENMELQSFDSLLRDSEFSPYCDSGSNKEGFNLLTFKYAVSGFSIGRLYREGIS